MKLIEKYLALHSEDWRHVASGLAATKKRADVALVFAALGDGTRVCASSLDSARKGRCRLRG